MDYEAKIVKRFQITKNTPANTNSSKFIGTKKYMNRKQYYSSNIQSGVNTAQSRMRNGKSSLMGRQKIKTVKPIPMWKQKPPEDKDKFEWKEKAYRKYLEHICETNGIQLPDTSNNKILFKGAT